MKTFLLSLFILAIGQNHSAQQATKYTEEQKINYLIQSIAHLDAQFIRNGSAYSAKDAADHLKMKRQKAGKAIKTARQFITEIASKSSMSGKAYQIKFKDGSLLNSGDFLLKKLKEIE